MTVKTLSGLTAEDKFKPFWAKVKRMVGDLDVSDPQLPRKRKVPRRYESGIVPHEYHSTVEAYYPITSHLI